ncbi:uncharacterized protein LOC105695336 [Orussus abietinus]|uniref:uncharacterized protein LOC105695336 n=1 Tax=Orussus abietinus TaxID=222816 RepID=UPI0006266607|nr:uncharacterized protein LOC105695336 [Orussus abietinus]
MVDIVTMKSSRKGTKLNDAHYFRQPLPHTRKKMTTLRVIPAVLSPQEDYSSDPAGNIRMREREKLERDQCSTELARFDYKLDPLTSFAASIGLDASLPSIPPVVPVASIAVGDEETLCTESSGFSIPLDTAPLPPETPEDEEPEEVDDTEKKPPSGEEKKETGGFKRLIVEFFSHILARWSSATRKRSKGTKAVSEGVEEKVAKAASKKRRQKTNRFADDSRGKDDFCAEDPQRSGERNLRAILLEHELRTRMLEKENACFKRMLQGRLGARQMSSPLY